MELATKTTHSTCNYRYSKRDWDFDQLSRWRLSQDQDSASSRTLLLQLYLHLPSLSAKYRIREGKWGTPKPDANAWWQHQAECRSNSTRPEKPVTCRYKGLGTSNTTRGPLLSTASRSGSSRSLVVQQRDAAWGRWGWECLVRSGTFRGGFAGCQDQTWLGCGLQWARLAWSQEDAEDYSRAGIVVFGCFVGRNSAERCCLLLSVGDVVCSTGKPGILGVH